jgi:uncharacterized protein YdhG (YjbR/CyaY superfamily)
VSAADVDAYLADVDEPKRSTLEQLRRTILTVIPEAEQGLSYGAPVFKVRGKAVAGFAAFTGHLTYAPHSGTVTGKLPDELAGYVVSKGSFQFAVDQPLPEPLVRRLIEVRMAEVFGE